MNTTTRDRLTDAILSEIVCSYQLPNGTRIQGLSISHLSQCLRDKGWKGVSNLNDLEDTVVSLGFKIVQAQMIRGIKEKLSAPARVVTL